MAKLELKEKVTQVRAQEGYNPSDEDLECISYVYQRKKEMGEKRKPWEDEWTRSEARYLPRFLGNGFGEKNKDPDLATAQVASEDDGWSALRIPVAHGVVQAALAEMSARTPEPIVKPLKKIYETQAKIVYDAIKFTWNKGDGDMELLRIITDKLVYGTGVGLELYVADQRKIKEIVAYDPETGEATYEEREIKDFEDPMMRWVSLWDVWFDDMVNEPKIELCRDMIYRRVYDVDEYKRYRAGFENSKYVMAAGSNKDDTRFDFFQSETHYTDNTVEELHYFNRATDEYIIVANDVLISKSPIPYTHKELPASVDRDIVDNHSFYGRGEPHLIEDLNQEIEALRNMRLDNLYVTIHKTFFYDSQLSLNDSDMWLAPGKGHPVQTGGRKLSDLILPVEFSDNKSSAFTEEDRLYTDVTRTTGIDPNLDSGTAGATATETAIQRETAMKRLALKLKYTEKVYLKRIYRLRVKLIQQFYSVTKVQKISDKEDIMAFRAVMEALILGDDAQKQEAATVFMNNFEVDQMTDDVYQYKKRIIYRDDDDGNQIFFELDPDDVRGEFFVDVVQGASMPISKPIQQDKFKNYVTDMMTWFPDLVNRHALAKRYTKIFDENPQELLLPEKPMISLDSLPPELQQIVSQYMEQQQMLEAGGEVTPDPAMGGSTNPANMMPEGDQIDGGVNPNLITPAIAGGALATDMQQGTGTGI